MLPWEIQMQPSAKQNIDYVSIKADGFLCLYLICFLVEAGRHLQQRTAFIQCRSKCLPLLLQLP